MLIQRKTKREDDYNQRLLTTLLDIFVHMFLFFRFIIFFDMLNELHGTQDNFNSAKTID